MRSISSRLCRSADVRVSTRRLGHWAQGEKTRDTKKHAVPAKAEHLGPQTVAQLQLLPLGSGKVSLAGAVNTTARICYAAQAAGDLDAVELGSTATVIEGKLHDVLDTVAKVAEAALHHNPRVMINMGLDIYPDQTNRLAKKQSVIQQTKQHVKHALD